MLYTTSRWAKWLLLPLSIAVLTIATTACSTPGFGAKTEPVTGTASNAAQTVGRTQGAATSIGVSSTTYNVYVAGMDAQVAKALSESLEGVPTDQLPKLIESMTGAFKAAGVTVNVTTSTSPSTVDNAGLGGESSIPPITDPAKPEIK